MSLPRVVFDGAAGVPHCQCSQILGKRYHRLDHVFAAEVELDDWGPRDELLRIGEIEMEPALDDTAAWLTNKW